MGIKPDGAPNPLGLNSIALASSECAIGTFITVRRSSYLF